MQPTNCLNCSALLETGQQFCGSCGQKTNTHRLTLGHFFHEFFHAFTHADKGIFHLLFGLLIRPGVVAREYIEGKRKKYFNPFTFFLIMMGIYVLSNRIFNPEPIEIHVPASIMNIPNEAAKNKAIAMFIRGGEVRNFTSANGNIISMIAIPMIALIFWLSYRKRKFNYAEHLTANMLFTSFANIFFAHRFSLTKIVRWNLLFLLIYISGIDITSWVLYIGLYGPAPGENFWRRVESLWNFSFISIRLDFVYPDDDRHLYLPELGFLPILWPNG